MSSTLSIYVSEAATPQHNGGDGKPGQSFAGHMWLGLDAVNSQNANRSTSQTATSMGFAPLKHGSIQGEGMVVRDDSFNYYGPKVHRIDIEVTDAQRAAILKFAENPKAHGFDMQYQGITNSCVDFSWKALDAAGLNPTHTEGQVLPTDNLPQLHKLAQDLKNSPTQQALLQAEHAHAMGAPPASKTPEPLHLDDSRGDVGSPEMAKAFREMPKDQALQRYPELQRAYHAQEEALHYAEKNAKKIAPVTKELFAQEVTEQLARQLHDFGPTLTDPRRLAVATAAGIAPAPAATYRPNDSFGLSR